MYLLVLVRDVDCDSTKGGKYYVIDGQHRTLAVLLVDKIRAVPCMLFPMKSIPEEAWCFVKAQKFRRPLSTHDHYRALLVQDDPAALIVKEICETTGYAVTGQTHANQKFSVQCVKRLLMEVERDEVLEDIWLLITEVCQQGSPHNYLIAGMCGLERELRLKEETLLSPNNRRALIRIGEKNLLLSMKKAADLFVCGSAESQVEGIRASLNSAARTRKLPAK